jgi:GTPase SAR1 and related small G proteins
MAAPNFQGRHMRQPSKNTLLKVVILGDGGVGKSCLMNRFVSNHYDEHSFHTIGVEFLNKDIEINGEIYTLQVSIAAEITIYFVWVD